MSGDQPVGDISIIGKGDAPPWKDIADGLEAAPSAGRTRYAILEAGMQSGATSLVIAFPLNGERWVCFETSLAMIEAVIASAHGAEQRWGKTR